MRLLLDTHTLIWAVDRPSLLGQDARVVLENTEQALMLSAATLWETAIKVGLNKLILIDFLSPVDDGNSGTTDHDRSCRRTNPSSLSPSRSLRPVAGGSGAD